MVTLTGGSATNFMRWFGAFLAASDVVQNDSIKVCIAHIASDSFHA